MTVAEKIQREVYEYWEENYPDWKRGIQVFYDPVDTSAEVLILGNQPGGGESSFEADHRRFSEGDFSPPSNHHYLNSNIRIATGLEGILGSNFERVIENSVKSNLNFFRAEDDEAWKSKMVDNDRKEIQEFCLDIVGELWEEVDPQVVLLEGMKAWDKAKTRFGFEESYSLHRIHSDGEDARLMAVSEQSDPLIIGVMHPSAQISSKHRTVMGRIAAKEMNPVLGMNLEKSEFSPEKLDSDPDLFMKSDKEIPGQV